MKKDTAIINKIEIDVYSLNTIIVGSGAAGFNAADSLYSLGQKDIAIVTEGINMGTSRNTGSDKQTYYKLTVSGKTADSVRDMAGTLFNGGSMHGDIALIEAALSAKAFFKLTDIGVPFPHNTYGEYIGYKTDHDPSQRATSAGPLTSKFMTEKLEEQVKQKGITIFDGFQVIGILTEQNDDQVTVKTVGLITINKNDLENASRGVTLFNCTNVIYAVGGPAGMYWSSVYPESQNGASGIAFEAGVKGINLTESQFGIASIKFRWNVSGTYQQVIPRYISTNSNGNDEKEFLNDYFENSGQMLDAIFLKGYQWPFDPRKIQNHGSSLIDLLVYNEIQTKGRRVFLDFTNNPSTGIKYGEFDFSVLGEEGKTYLSNSGALFGRPIERLAKMNQPAIDLYMDKGIDLSKEYLEIAVCAQHNNGGLIGNLWWESNILHLFPVGEVNGTFGVYRPGGSALNSTQVGSLRAAQFIASNYIEEPMKIDLFLLIVDQQINKKLEIIEKLCSTIGSTSNVMETRETLQKRMSRYGAHIRSTEGCTTSMNECLEDFKHLIDKTCIASVEDIPFAFMNRDLLICQFVYLCAIKEYIHRGGKSRGSYLIEDRNEEFLSQIPKDMLRVSLDSRELSDYVCEMSLKVNECNLEYLCEWKPVRLIPKEDNWFENVWKNYRNKKIISNTNYYI